MTITTTAYSCTLVLSLLENISKSTFVCYVFNIEDNLYVPACYVIFKIKVNKVLSLSQASHH